MLLGDWFDGNPAPGPNCIISPQDLHRLFSERYSSRFSDVDLTFHTPEYCSLCVVDSHIAHQSDISLRLVLRDGSTKELRGRIALLYQWNSLTSILKIKCQELVLFEALDPPDSPGLVSIPGIFGSLWQSVATPGGSTSGHAAESFAFSDSDLGLSVSLWMEIAATLVEPGTPALILTADERALVSRIPLSDLEDLFHGMDLDGDGTISPMEFSINMQSLHSGLQNIDEFKLFSAIDKDGNGAITLEELVEGWVRLQEIAILSGASASGSESASPVHL